MQDTVTWYVGNFDGSVQVSDAATDRALAGAGEVEWGNYGDGSAVLARVLLADALGRETVPIEETSAFKADVVAGLPHRRAWSMTRDSVVEWHRRYWAERGMVCETPAPTIAAPAVGLTIY